MFTYRSPVRFLLLNFFSSVCSMSPVSWCLSRVLALQYEIFGKFDSSGGLKWNLNYDSLKFHIQVVQIYTFAILNWQISNGDKYCKLFFRTIRITHNGIFRTKNKPIFNNNSLRKSILDGEFPISVHIDFSQDIGHVVRVGFYWAFTPSENLIFEEKS